MARPRLLSLRTFDQFCTVLLILFLVILLFDIKVDLGKIRNYQMPEKPTEIIREAEEEESFECGPDWQTAEQGQSFLRCLRQLHISPPAPPQAKYNLSPPPPVPPPSDPEHEQYHQKLLDILKSAGIEKGFFVEAGALDGQTLSHTLDLEMEEGWSGLLVEASPSLIPLLKGKNRKAWTASVCLWTQKYARLEFMTTQNTKGREGNGRLHPRITRVPYSFGFPIRDYHYRSEGEVDCFTLADILAAINVDQVDLLVLDLEGGESEILKGFPFSSSSSSSIPIKVVGVKISGNPGASTMLIWHMKKNGYELAYRGRSDLIFVQKPRD